MTNHRASTDQTFQTHLDSLTETSLDAKLTAWEALQTDLSVENTETAGHRSQLSKHRVKVDEMVENLETLKAFEQSQTTNVILPTVYSGLDTDDEIPILVTDRIVVLVHDQVTGLIATLPANPTNGQVMIIKNMHTGTASYQDEYKVVVRVQPSQTPAHFIDYKYTELELNVATSTTTLMDDENEACRLVWYEPAKTWLNINDSY